jgi:hypothetical protein
MTETQNTNNRIDSAKLAEFLCENNDFKTSKSRFIKYFILNRFDLDETGGSLFDSEDSVTEIFTKIFEKIQKDKDWFKFDKIFGYLFDLQGIEFDFLNTDQKYVPHGPRALLKDHLNQKSGIFQNGWAVDEYGIIGRNDSNILLDLGLKLGENEAIFIRDNLLNKINSLEDTKEQQIVDNLRIMIQNFKEYYNKGTTNENLIAHIKTELDKLKDSNETLFLKIKSE